jgi:VanZ family protein
LNPTRLDGYWKAAGWLLVLAIIAVSLMPAPPHLNVEQGDKLGHFAAYGLVTLWFAQPYTALRQRIWLALGMVALGIGLEYAQRATGYRSFEVADMAADALGVAIGWLAAPPRLPNLLSWVKKSLFR